MDKFTELAFYIAIISFLILIAYFMIVATTYFVLTVIGIILVGLITKLAIDTRKGHT